MIRYFGLPILLLLLASCDSNNMLKEVKQLNYSSASGIEYFNSQFYIIGDDANNLMILDSNLNPTDSITLYPFAEKRPYSYRVPKKLKADLEGITITKDNQLLLLGSGSLSPYRNTVWLIDPLTKQKDSIRLDTFYQRLILNGIKEINIEGVCAIPGSLILTNRGSKGYPKNYLIVTSNDFWKDQFNAPVSLMLAGSATDTFLFNGVSGLAYAKKSDQLILTVSTEDTRNSMDDGTIGKSYLWMVNSISSKKKWKAINPDRIIDLEETDPRFKRQKIESVCITKETKDFIYLVLAADNDNGSSTLFTMVVKKD